MVRDLLPTEKMPHLSGKGRFGNIRRKTKLSRTPELEARSQIWTWLDQDSLTLRWQPQLNKWFRPVHPSYAQTTVEYQNHWKERSYKHIWTHTPYHRGEKILAKDPRSKVPGNLPLRFEHHHGHATHPTLAPSGLHPRPECQTKCTRVTLPLPRKAQFPKSPHNIGPLLRAMARKKRKRQRPRRSANRCFRP